MESKIGKIVYALEILDIYSDEFKDFDKFMSCFSNKHPYSQLREGPYEYSHVKLLPGDIIIDAGANVGIFSAYASKKIIKDNLKGHIYSFEPIPSNIELLKQTAAFNGAMTIVPNALSDKTGTIQIYTSSENIGSHTILPGKFENKIDVAAKALDDFIHENNIRKIDFLKADIEGAERLLLKGAKYTLKTIAPKISICTYHLPDDSEVLRELIMDANPNYVIEEKWRKMYAYVPK
jgi:FkbM family methyltransferase